MIPLRSVDELAYQLEPGATLGLGGAFHDRLPSEFMGSLARSGADELALWTIFAGAECLPLFRCGAVKTVHTSYLAPDLDIERDSAGDPVGYTLCEWPEWLFLLIFQAGRLGLRVLPYPLVETVPRSAWQTVEHEGETLSLVPVPGLSHVVIRAERADRYGNVSFAAESRFLCELDIAMAETATTTFVLVDRLANETISRPDLRAVHVDAIAVLAKERS